MKQTKPSLHQWLPVLQWVRQYRWQDLSGDMMAGVVVTIMLVPQAMAYALLAGLPPQVGLYASIIPLLLYGLLGTSHTLAVGPVAIVSLLVTTGITPLAQPGSAVYVELAFTLAFLVGVVQVVMSVARLGFVVNFMSHPVLVGFTNAAAVVIGFSQLKHLLGISIPNLEFFELVSYTLEHLGETNLVTFVIGLGAIIILFYFKNYLKEQLNRWGIAAGIALPLSKSAPLVVVVVGTLLVAGWGLNESAGVKIVGEVPAGLPALTVPVFELAVWWKLLPTAVTIGFVGYVESMAVAKSLASKRRQKVGADQELLALGIANVGAALTGGYPVTGGFSRSVVNFEAGANTGLASMITAVLITFTLIFLTPLFYFLPQTVLAAIVMVAVASLWDVKTLRHVWQYNKADAVSLVITFGAVLAFDVEVGIAVGVGTALLLFIWRTSKPHVAVVGRLGESEIYRNVLRHQVQTWPQAVVMRMDESLYFANTKYLEDTVLGLLAERQEVKHFVLIGTAVNFIDASALETLESLHHELTDMGVIFHLAAVKGPVMDRLEKVGFVERFGRQHIHLSTHEAMKVILDVDENGFLTKR